MNILDAVIPEKLQHIPVVRNLIFLSVPMSDQRLAPDFRSRIEGHQRSKREGLMNGELSCFLHIVQLFP